RVLSMFCLFFFSSRRRHTRFSRDWSSDVCSSDLLNGEVYCGLANVGCKPTFDYDKPLVEVFINQFSRDIYGALLTVEFLHFLREEKKFASPEALKAQLLLDQKQGEELRRRYACAEKR